MSDSEAKKAILSAIRGSLAASRPHDRARAAHHGGAAAADSAPAPPAPKSAPPEEILIENFRASLEFVGARFTAVFGEREAAEAVRAIIEAKAAERVAFSGAPLVRRIVAAAGARAEFIEDAAAGELFETDLGVTGAQYAIAETGTLVLENDRERNRLTSLVPPVHVCLVEARDLRQTLGEVLALLQTDLSRAVTFVTGASRTSDIELTLAIGVHGPGELHVVLIQ